MDLANVLLGSTVASCGLAVIFACVAGWQRNERVACESALHRSADEVRELERQVAGATRERDVAEAKLSAIREAIRAGGKEVTDLELERIYREIQARSRPMSPEMIRRAQLAKEGRLEKDAHGRFTGRVIV